MTTPTPTRNSLDIYGLRDAIKSHTPSDLPTFLNLYTPTPHPNITISFNNRRSFILTQDPAQPPVGTRDTSHLPGHHRLFLFTNVPTNVPAILHSRFYHSDCHHDQFTFGVTHGTTLNHLRAVCTVTRTSDNHQLVHVWPQTLPTHQAAYNCFGSVPEYALKHLALLAVRPISGHISPSLLNLADTDDGGSWRAYFALPMAADAPRTLGYLAGQSSGCGYIRYGIIRSTTFVAENPASPTSQRPTTPIPPLPNVNHILSLSPSLHIPVTPSTVRVPIVSRTTEPGRPFIRRGTLILTPTSVTLDAPTPTPLPTPVAATTTTDV